MRSLARLIDGAGCSEQSRAWSEDMRGAIPPDHTLLLIPRALPWPREPPSLPANGFAETRADPLRTLWIQDCGPACESLISMIWTADERVLRAVDKSQSCALTSLLAVCLHGSHDPCCGTRGGKLLARLAGLNTERRILGASHMSGDRFAANALLLPEGYLLGRLDDCTDEILRELLDRRTLPPGHIRGRLGLSPAEAATEIWFREQQGLWSLDDEIEVRTVAKVPSSSSDAQRRVQVKGAGVVVMVELFSQRDEDRLMRYTCASECRAALYGWSIIQTDQD